VIAIQAEHLSKRFMLHHDRPRSLQELLAGVITRRRNHGEEFWALRDASFQVKKGEMLGVIGPNGAGKSTLLKLIARVLEPTSGTITAQGRVGALLELGTGFHPDLSGRENIFLNGTLLGLTQREIQQRMDEIIAFGELEHFIDIPLRNYSSGMQMRLGFAVAVHVNPDILLIDEVLAVGDEAFQRKCLRQIHRLRREEKTIIFVSHGLGSVAQLCDQALWLEDGRVHEKGPVREVIDRYLLSVAEKEARALAEQADAEAKEELEERVEPTPPGVRGRWGTKEIELSRVRMLDAQGSESYLFRCGESVTVEVEYEVHREVEAPTFGVAIFRDDGLWCYGTNTDLDRIYIDSLPRNGVVRVHFDRFGFVPGTYFLDVAAHNKRGHPYDYLRACRTFSIHSLIKDAGVFRPEHRWAFDSSMGIVSGPA
jgi:ABC-type polysaccharide/polyol phosphate transport system ATPase subunit